MRRVKKDFIIRMFFNFKIIYGKSKLNIHSSEKSKCISITGMDFLKTYLAREYVFVLLSFKCLIIFLYMFTWADPKNYSIMEVHVFQTISKLKVTKKIDSQIHNPSTTSKTTDKTI